MSRRGNCWDNAVAISFFSSLKKERIKKRIYITWAKATAEIDAYIETFYHRTRRHSHLREVSPEALKPLRVKLTEVSAKVWEVQFLPCDPAYRFP